MRTIIRLLGVAVVGVLFAASLAELHPHPYLYDDSIFLCSFVLFFLAYVVSPARVQSFIVQFALLNFVVFFILDLWYWIGAWKFGFWYPRAPEIVERFIHVDGESGYNAEVSNLFLLVWPTVLLAWWLWKRAAQPTDATVPLELHTKTTRKCI